MKPHVTNLLQLLNKPALLDWSNKLGLKGIELKKYRKNIMSDGTSLHKQIENYVLKNIPFENKEMGERYLNFMLDKEIISIEESIENEYFTGRVDVILKWNDKKYLCDFKSNKTKVYLENKLQLVAYNMVKKCDRLAVISIPDFSIIECDIFDYEPYEKIILSLVNIHNQLKITNNEL